MADYGSELLWKKNETTYLNVRAMSALMNLNG